MMPPDLVLVWAVGVLAVVYAVSGAAKIGRPAPLLASMGALKVPAVLRTRAVAYAVPVAELALAVALLLCGGVALVAVAVASALLMIVFTVLLVGTLRRGDEVDCGCFGALSQTASVTWWSVGRNLFLVALSVVIAVLALDSGASGLIPRLWSMPVGYLVVLALAWALTLLAVLVREIVVLRRAARARAVPSPGPGTASTAPAPVASAISPDRTPAPLSPMSLALGIDPARPGEVAPGDAIPQAELVTATGRTLQLHHLGGGRPVLLIFASTECGSCTPVGEAVLGWVERLAPLVVLLATSSHPGAVEKKFPGVEKHAVYGASAARSALGVQGTPAAVAFGSFEHPIVASPIAYGLGEIEGLVTALEAAQPSAQ